MVSLGSFGGGLAGGAAINIIISAVDNYSKTFKDVSKKNQSLTRTILSSKMATVGLTAAFGATTIAVVKLTQAGIEQERSQTAFNQLMGDAANDILPKMRKESRGLASDLDLMNAANRAVLLGISKDQLPELMGVAAARARLMGISVSQAAADIATGIGRESRMILDNLGIILNVEDATKAYAETLGKTSEELTALERKTAIANAVIEESKALMIEQAFAAQTAGEQIQAFKAQIDNLTNSYGTQFIEGIKTIVKLRELNEISKDTGVSIGELVDYTNTATSALQGWASVLKEIREEAKAANDELKNMKDEMLGISETPMKGDRKLDLDIAKTKKNIALENSNQNNVKMSYEELINSEETVKKLEMQLEALESKKELNQLASEEQAAQAALALEQMGDMDVKEGERAIKSEDIKTAVNEQLIGYNEQKIVLAELLKQQDSVVAQSEAIALDYVNQALSMGLTKDHILNAVPGMSSLADESEAFAKNLERAANAARSFEGGKSSFRSGVDKVANNAIFNAVAPGVAAIMKASSFASSLSTSSKFNDFISRPGQQTASFSPDDTIIGVKNPSALGGSSINITIENVYGTDPDQMAMALEEKLSSMIKIH